jgi:uncharacterized NAD-dependent epimerase/dehydratase family protein
METGVAGIFAVGDVRAGSVKRVGAAIGEGAAVVAQLHTFLARRNPTLRGSADNVASRPGSAEADSNAALQRLAAAGTSQ